MNKPSKSNSYNFFLNIKLGRLYGARVEKRDIEGEGIEEDCVVIPLRRNGIRKGKGNLCVLRAVTHKIRIPEHYPTHFISLYLKPELKEEMDKLGYSDRLSFIGDANMMTPESVAYLRKQRENLEKLRIISKKKQ